MKAKTLQVFEHQSIAYKGRHEFHGFTKEMFGVFEAYFQRNEHTPFFSLIPNGVRFNEYVGAIQIGKTTIEVLPKAGTNENKGIWQRVLLDMLKTCHLLTAKESGEAPLRLRSNSILDLYFELYIAELESLLHRGLIKKYRKQEGQQKALRGALVFSQHASKNIVHKERFYTRHSIYDHNHLLHQILREALTIIEHLSSSPFLMDRIGRLELDFPEVAPLKVTPKHFDRLTLNRKTLPYRKAIEIAKLLILNFRPDISSGRQDLLAIMFDMNRLWEEYVYRILKKKMSGAWEIQGQQNKYFWETKRVRPDLVIRPKDDPNRTYIIDTKWKVIDNKHPADDDLKQMYVYNHHWGSSMSVLLYPETDGQEDRYGTYSLRFKDNLHHCKLAFVEVVDEKGLNPNLAQDIIDKLPK